MRKEEGMKTKEKKNDSYVITKGVHESRWGNFLPNPSQGSNPTQTLHMDRVEPTGGHFFFITIITKLS